MALRLKQRVKLCNDIVFDRGPRLNVTDHRAVVSKAPTIALLFFVVLPRIAVIRIEEVGTERIKDRHVTKIVYANGRQPGQA